MANDSLDLGAIWTASKAYMGSNTLKRFDGIVDTGSVKNLGDFAKSHQLDLGGDFEEKFDERLQKYNIMKYTPTKHLEEIDNMVETYVITDQFGHDIGRCTVVDGKIEFIPDKKIEDANRKIISQFPEGSQEREMLEEMYKLDSLEDVVKRIASGKELALSCKEQAQDEILKEKAGFQNVDIENSQDEDEKDAIEAIPSDMREQVLSLCRDQNIKVKEILIVDCPKCVEEEMVNGTNNINFNGGPIIMVQAKSGGAELSDDLYMFQDGVQIPNVEADKDRMLTLMEEHKGEGAVPELDDTREDSLRFKIENQIALAESRIEENPENEAQIRKELDLSVQSIVKSYGGTPSQEITEVQEQIHEQSENAQQEQEDEEEEYYPGMPIIPNHEEPTIYDNKK